MTKEIEVYAPVLDVFTDDCYSAEIGKTIFFRVNSDGEIVDAVIVGVSIENNSRVVLVLEVDDSVDTLTDDLPAAIVWELDRADSGAVQSIVFKSVTLFGFASTIEVSDQALDVEPDTTMI